MRFENPANGYVEAVSVPWLWCLLFGALYLAWHEAWFGVMLWIVVIPLTAGLAWLVFPFFAELIIRRQYLRSGWIEKRP